MKVRENFKHAGKIFEAGNTYEPALHGITAEELNIFHKCGWVSIDGKDDCERNPSKAVLMPESIKVKANSQNI